MAVSDYIKKYQAAGKLNQSAALPPLATPQNQAPAAAPVFQPIAGQTISAAKPSLSSRLISLLPTKAQPIAESIFGSVHDALFGNAKDKAAGITPQPGPENNPLLSLATAGVLGRPKSEGYLSSLGKTPQEQVQQNARALEQKGVDADRAAKLAFYEIFGRDNPGASAKDAQVIADAKQKYQALAPNADESRTLSMARFFQGIGSAGDVVGVLPLGSLAKEGSQLPKALEGLAQHAHEVGDAATFVRSNIFERSLSGEEIKALSEYKGNTIADKLSTFYKDVSKAAPQEAAGAATGLPSKSRVATSLPDTRSQELFTNLKASKPEDVSTILNTSPSQFTNRSFISEHITRLREVSQQSLPAFKQLVEEATGITPAVRVKSAESIAGKIDRYMLKEKNPAHIADTLAGRIVVKNNDIAGQLDNLQRNLKVENVDNYFENPTDFGYRGINAHVRLPNGQLAEVQIHTAESLKIADEIHPSYEKWRNRDLSNITPEQKIEYIADKTRSRKLAENVLKTSEGTRERGFVTSAKEVIPEASKIAGQYVPRETDDLAIKAKNLIKDNITEAERVAMTGSDDRAVAVASELLKHYASTASKTVDKAAKNALYDQAAEIANRMAERLTELGRSVQAASILGRLTPEGQVRFAAKEILKWNAAHPGQKVPELTGAQSNKIYEDMLKVIRMPDGEAKAVAFQKVQDQIRKLIPSTWIDKVIAVWKAGLLTGLKTTGVNFFANLSHAATEIAKDVPAAAADTLLSLITGKRTVAATTGGFSQGVNEGIGRGWQYFKTGYDSREVAKAFDGMRVNFKSKAIQGYVDAVFRALGAADQPFYYGALRHSLYSQAVAAAKNKGATGLAREAFIRNLVENPSNEMATYALADAEQAVFLNRTELGKIGSKIQQTKVGQFVLPFARTPSAVAMQIINYSPLGGFVEIGKQILRGKFDQRLLSQAIGRSATGLGVLWTGSELFKHNLVSLDYPASEKERELWKAEGRTPNSVKVGGKWRTVQVLGPAGPTLLLGAHYAQALKDTGSPTGAMVTAFASNWKSFTEQTFLRGINDTISAITDPARNASTVAASFMSSVIPTIVNDIARATDSKERLTAGRTFATTVANRVESRIPGLRETLQPQVDVLGNERAAAGNPLEILADPTRPSKATETPVTQELRRLMEAGFNASPSLLGDKAGFAALTPEQNTKVWKLAGSITNDKLTSLFAKDAYQKLPDDNDKANAVTAVVKQSQINARASMVLELTQGLDGAELSAELSKLKAGGLMTQEVFRTWQQMH